MKQPSMVAVSEQFFLAMSAFVRTEIESRILSEGGAEFMAGLCLSVRCQCRRRRGSR